MALNTISGGAYQDMTGLPLKNGSLLFELSHDEQETSTTPHGQVVGGLKRTIFLDNNGNVATGSQLWANDVMSPANSYYIVKAFRQDGTLALKSPQYWQIPSSPNPFDLGTLVPANPPGSGLGSFSSITLQTNEVNNGSQTLLDLHAGTNISLADNGVGRVTITASGGASASYMFGAGNFSIAGTTTVQSVSWTDTALKVYFAKFQTPYSCNFSKMDLVGGSNLGGGTDVVVGVYDSTASTLLWTLGPQHLTNVSATNFSYALSPHLILTPGTYYMAWTGSDNGNGSVYGWDVGSFTFKSGGSDVPIVNQNAITFGSAANAATSGPVLPATLGALSGNSSAYVTLPAFFFQV